MAMYSIEIQKDQTLIQLFHFAVRIQSSRGQGSSTYRVPQRPGILKLERKPFFYGTAKLYSLVMLRTCEVNDSLKFGFHLEGSAGDGGDLI